MRNEKAFTLLEILISVFIFSLIGAIVAGGFISGNRIKDSQEGVIEIQQNLRVAVQIMSQDIRMCGYELAPHWEGSKRALTSVVSATPAFSPNGSNSIQFRYLADSDNDGQPEDTNGDGYPDSSATLTYHIDNNFNLVRTYNNPNMPAPANVAHVDTVASNIIALWITYLWSDGTWHTSPAPFAETIQTRAVGLTIVGESTNANKNINSAVTFNEPTMNDGLQTVTLNNQRDHRMFSTIIELKNLNSVL